MPLAPTDLAIKYSTKSGSAGNSLSSTAAASLGKYISTTEVTTNVLYNLFATMTGDQNAASADAYICLFLHNKNASGLTLISPMLWVSAVTANSALYAIGVDSNPASAIASGSTQAAQIASASAVPAGVTFTAPTSKSTGLNLGDIAPGFARPFWVRRRGNNTAAVNADNVTFSFEGDTRA